MLALLVMISAVTSQQLTCERIDNDYGALTCRMDRATRSFQSGTVISSVDKRVTRLKFDRNKKITHLPILVYQVFSELEFYSARSCAIKTISGSNFEKLVRLKEIHLSGNLIETIDVRTFNDVLELRILKLGKNGRSFNK